MKREHFLCDCEALEHTIRMSYFVAEESDDQNLYIEMFLNKPNSFFKRLWIALKYVFSKNPSKYGDVGEYILSPATAGDMIEFMELFIISADRKSFLELLNRIIRTLRDTGKFSVLESCEVYSLATQHARFADLLMFWYYEVDPVVKEACFSDVVKIFTELQESVADV